MAIRIVEDAYALRTHAYAMRTQCVRIVEDAYAMRIAVYRPAKMYREGYLDVDIEIERLVDK